MTKIDLHLHTTASDGDTSPEKIVELALQNELKVIAITDHDTIDGIERAVDYSQGKNIKIIPGIEISCHEPDLGFEDVHILGLFIDYHHKRLIEFNDFTKEERIKQKKEMIKKLNDLGFDLTFEEVLATVGSSFGRPHLAGILLKKYPQEFSSTHDVFAKYLDNGKPAYVERRTKTSMKQVISIIKKANGLPFLAHPGVYKKEDALKLIDKFVRLGGVGIETSYPYNLIIPSNYDAKKGQEIIFFYEKIAQERGLLESGGSDFHGEIRPVKIGERGLDEEKFEKINFFLTNQARGI